MGRRDPRSGNIVEMEVAISGKGYVFRGQTPVWRQGLSSLWRRPATHAARMLNIFNSAQMERNRVTTPFPNCNTLIINHFRNCGVEDELEEKAT